MVARSCVSICSAARYHSNYLVELAALWITGSNENRGADRKVQTVDRGAYVGCVPRIFVWVHTACTIRSLSFATSYPSFSGCSANPLTSQVVYISSHDVIRRSNTTIVLRFVAWIAEKRRHAYPWTLSSRCWPDWQVYRRTGAEPPRK